MLDAEKFCAGFLPVEIPDDFAKLKIPLTVMATDLYGRAEVALASGPLRPAIGASIAIPGLIRPVELDGRVLVDGAAVNPLPFDRLRGSADILIAVDVVRRSGRAGRRAGRLGGARRHHAGDRPRHHRAQDRRRRAGHHAAPERQRVRAVRLLRGQARSCGLRRPSKKS